MALHVIGSFGGLAQPGERLICIQEVAGSIPVSSTKFSISGRVAELVDALVLGTSGATRESSSLSLPTNSIRSLRLSVRTRGFHPRKRGSTPLGTAKHKCARSSVG